MLTTKLNKYISRHSPVVYLVHISNTPSLSSRQKNVYCRLVLSHIVPRMQLFIRRYSLKVGFLYETLLTSVLKIFFYYSLWCDHYTNLYLKMFNTYLRLYLSAILVVIDSIALYFLWVREWVQNVLKNCKISIIS